MRPPKTTVNITGEEKERLNRLSYFIKKYVADNQIEQAEALGVAQSNLSNSISGKKKISLAILSVLRDKYKMNIEWYHTGTGKEIIDIKEKASTLITDIKKFEVTMLSMQKKIDILELNLNQAFKEIQYLRDKLEQG